MSAIEVGELRIDPSVNPAVLDTGSWDFDAASAPFANLNEEQLSTLERVGSNPEMVRQSVIDLDERVRIFPGSYARSGGAHWFLAENSDDGQRVLLEVAVDTTEKQLGEHGAVDHQIGAYNVRVHPTDADTLNSYFRHINPEQGPRALGGVPRLGIGVRHSTFMWPGVWRAMHHGSFSANAIQNSVRELHRLETLTSGAPSGENYQFSFGTISAGHTGSTFEGLWTYGALSALSDSTTPRYGADADHIQVKRGKDGLARAKSYLDAARYYSFYTLDVSDVLNYPAAWEFSSAESTRLFEEAVPSKGLRQEILAYHGKSRWFFGQTYRLDEAQIGRFVGKYWHALDEIEQLVSYLESIRDGVPFDLELSIDETPPEIPTFDAITTEAELLFLMLEIKRRSIPVTHLAPNFGIEKNTDYRGPDGLPGLEHRFHRLYLLSSELGFFLDCHSGDDLSRETRCAIGRATSGRIHFKVSPSLQVWFGETLYDMYPDRFEWWWNDTIKWVREEAERGSTFAIDCLREFERSENPRPHPKHELFVHYNFATVGRRAPDGSFENRHRFYDLSNEFAREFTKRMTKRLVSIAGDVFQHPC